MTKLAQNRDEASMLRSQIESQTVDATNSDSFRCLAKIIKSRLDSKMNPKIDPKKATVRRLLNSSSKANESS